MKKKLISGMFSSVPDAALFAATMDRDQAETDRKTREQQPNSSGSPVADVDAVQQPLNEEKQPE